MHDSTMTTFFLIIGTVGILVFGIIFYFVYKGVSEWNRNNKAPKISVKVFVKGKNSESHISSNYNVSVHSPPHI